MLPLIFLIATAVLIPDVAGAVTVRGFVHRTVGGNPVANVDLDVFDSATGAFVFIINDKTGVDGLYQIVINPGTYDVTYTPPSSARLAGFRRAALVVAGNQNTVLTLPDTLLEPGLLVTGHVQDTSLPAVAAPNVQVRFFEAATGLSVFAAANATNASGNFSVLVPARAYDLIFAPAALDTLLPVRLAAIPVAADTVIPTVSLSRGFLLSGDVHDPLGAAVAGADADAFDAFTGDPILTVHDDSDALGHFSFAVPAGILDVSFFQPAGSTLAARRVEGIIVSGATTIPPVVLPAGVRFSGRAIDALGQPVPAVELNLIDLDTGSLYPTARDATDTLGNYSVNVPPGLYDVRFIPPVGTGLAGAIRPQVPVTADLVISDVILPSARLLTGRILDGGAGFAPVAGVDFVVFDDISGKGFPSVGAPTALDGTFSLALPPGKWVIEPLPPRGSLLLTVKQPAVDLAAVNGSLGNITLQRGVTLSGRVLGPAGPVRDVDLDVFDALGTRLITLRDNTDPLGFYSVVVPDNTTYSVRYEPPRSTDLAAVSLAGVAVAGPTTWPDLVLQRGVIVTGRVVEAPAIPVFDVDLNVTTSIGVLYLTPHDSTLSDGSFKVVLPSGGDATATINFSPPRGSRLLFLSQAPLDLTVDKNLGDIPLTAGLLISGRVTRPDGSGVRDADLTVFDTATRFSIRTPHDNTDGAGDYIAAVPPGIYNINYLPPRPLPVGERLVPGRVALLNVTADTPGVNVALQNGVWVKGRVETSTHAPVALADLDFINSLGATQFTPQDRTDASGVFSLVVPPGIYALTVQPPAGSHLIGARRTAVDLTSDNLGVPAFVLHSGYFLEGFILDENGKAVAGADIDVLDPVTGAALFTPGDNTDLMGHFSVTIPPGVWDLHLEAPLNSNLSSLLAVGVLVTGDTHLPDTILPAGFRAEGSIFDAGSTPVPGAEAVFTSNGKLWPVQGNVADISGRFRCQLPNGTYDVTFDPPAGLGLAPLTRAGIVVSGDLVLADAHLPAAQSTTLAAVSPTSGLSTGGGPATLSGTGFVAGARVLFGGVEAQVTSLSATSITVVVPPHPAGPADVAVVNPGSMASLLPSGFDYVRPSADISLSLTRSGDDLILSWAPTGQTIYTVFRAGTAQGIRTPLVLRVTNGVSLTIVGGAHPIPEGYYDVE